VILAAVGAVLWRGEFGTAALAPADLVRDPVYRATAPVLSALLFYPCGNPLSPALGGRVLSGGGLLVTLLGHLFLRDCRPLLGVGLRCLAGRAG